MAGLREFFAVVLNKVILLSAFLTCLGMTFIILACALPSQKLWWPFFVVLFYAMSIIPIAIAKRSSHDTGNSSCMDFALFLTAGIVLSTFAFPIVLAKSQVIFWTACNLTIAGNVVIYLTMLVFALRENNPDGVYGGMF